MEVFLAAAVIFGIAFLGMAIRAMRGKHCPGCSCKAAGRLMNGTEQPGCTTRLYQISAAAGPSTPENDAG